VAESARGRGVPWARARARRLWRRRIASAAIFVGGGGRRRGEED
jgi:hypothetical protein